MKLPKTFRPDKDLEEKTKQLVKSAGVIAHFDARLDNLFEGCKDFIKKTGIAGVEEAYHIAQDIIGDINYSMTDVEELSAKIKKGPSKLGFYFSALVNRVIPDGGVITLDLNWTFDGVGCYLDKGLLQINGDVGNFAGAYIDGGEIYIAGSTQDYLAHNSKSGTIIVQGILGKISEDTSTNVMIYNKMEKVWPR
ncbi:MAG: hypothetical protein KKA79_03170 [Nanoarchaeota archaeon]|nr:hypothetical protein [Nanoarchaeota archaeon]